ncbi:MAG: 4-(cytidine 5'-diphospho)-2-C-methyl-D-erythritol kinase [Oscillospiraceae bacterium]|jgi:4-diphosphocytidyl-2-C-methyl-D-erythritol kinase|nr:4-(cytidine 5'-diphospho)-2-C-methyl-D-erythritol kinase [Oscillospiraceae bacterium]
MNGAVTLPAYAKLNLYLDIKGKNSDGYHKIESVMREIDLADTVTVRVNDDTGGNAIVVECDNPAIPTDERNTAFRAAALFMEASGRRFGADIDISKKIPVMAGLGGSSADGAAVLKALNGIYNVFDDAELLKIGAVLGADVPFCLTGKAAFCEGIGDIITPLPVTEKFFYLIIQPDFKLSTKSAYEMYDRGFRGRGPVSRGELYNVFQVLYDDGRIDGICRALVEKGASGASMTGSGSAVFGVFTERETAVAAYNELDYPFKFIARGV